MRIKNAWYPPSMANRVAVELPNGQLKHFNQTPFREVQESELEPYEGFCPSGPDSRVPLYLLRHYGLELTECPEHIVVSGAWRSIQDTGVIYLRMPDGSLARAKLYEQEPRVRAADLRPDNNVDLKGWHDLYEVEPYLYSYFNLVCPSSREN